MREYRQTARALRLRKQRCGMLVALRSTVRRFLALAKAMGALADGDTLVVCKLDRLARSTRDLLNTFGCCWCSWGCLQVTERSWADTTTAHGKLMLTVLGGLAEFERHLILRQDQRRPTTCPSSWCSFRQKAKANCASAAGSISKARRWRGVG